MRKITAIALIAISTTLEVGCLGKPLSTDKVSGLYEYDSGDPGTESVCFVLSPDGTYALGNATAPTRRISFWGTQSEGQWRLTETPQGQQIQIGDSSFPIKRTSSGARVILDVNHDMYCDFSKPK